MPNTREKLIEILADLDCNAEYCKDCEFCTDIDGCVRRQKEIIADRLIANGVTIRQWIPVTERLPEADKKVLVFTAGGSFKVARCNFYKNGTEVNWATNDGLGERAITHWMPLPKPPKGE